MSRIGKKPVAIPSGVTINVAAGNQVEVKSTKATLNKTFSADVTFNIENGVATVSPKNNSKNAIAQSGTARAILNNMVEGVSKGFERKLKIIGVGYRAKAQGSELNLTLGFSHPVVYKLPQGITAETPAPTEIILKGADKEVLGKVASEIREYRKPEPYKGKGVRYEDEYVAKKEAKKK
ncbi:50S ribosomal protein L6 [Francisella philomiragia]|uniref:Large ribosomal subunit protein uL6 n=1 Tax=Francisella philomiragia TaxID=28110 RepID=A0ABS1GDU1_9GAMM|nr:50S ribosomal protein L6 [Francisella philomiragia]AJI56281.1 ribosomal protein L6 [Francisella philomiragia]AJI74256.1 ribosomal protein L6 [Francisella philomiragia subsp. philomiragia ATCC 25015]EET20356.1 50S ribosomal protein L6 [Francisella philomiragia subsp. philomiragia ATCC 25015]MBK2025648.1 50S ribosomal protein L6 [Francisella philomiragia]MBK2092575.1 50S ribosomal protein L6 [Francisella philomiragia]